MRIQRVIKRLKQDSPVFFTLITFALLITISTLVIIDNQANSATDEAAYPVMAPKTVDVKLERVYLDGEVSEEIVQETIWSMEDFWSFYNDWFLVDQNEEVIHFRQQVDDISPLLKINGYFGISPDGFLNIYEGRPNDENVIQSFFQINTEKLKSHQQIELKEGIPVMTTENYKEVIQMLKQYAIKEI